MKLLVLVPLLACLAVTGCSGDPQDDYCQEVEEHQVALSDIAASEDPGAIFDALDTYDDLAAKAPRDIADDWAAVIDPLRDLQQVLADNGVDVSTYSADSTAVRPRGEGPRGHRGGSPQRGVGADGGGDGGRGAARAGRVRHAPVAMSDPRSRGRSTGTSTIVHLDRGRQRDEAGVVSPTRSKRNVLMNLRRTLAALATTALVVLAAPAGGAFASHGSDDGARHGGAHHNGPPPTAPTTTAPTTTAPTTTARTTTVPTTTVPTTTAPTTTARTTTGPTTPDSPRRGPGSRRVPPEKLSRGTFSSS